MSAVSALDSEVRINDCQHPLPGEWPTLIVSEFGTLRDGDVVMAPEKVAAYLQGSAIDIGLKGKDLCFGNGRIDALRAVLHETNGAYEAAPFCPEYDE